MNYPEFPKNDDMDFFYDEQSDLDIMDDYLSGWIQDGKRLEELSPNDIMLIFKSNPTYTQALIGKFKDIMETFNVAYDDDWSVDEWKEFVMELIGKSKDLIMISNFLELNGNHERAFEFISYIKNIIY